MNIPALRKALHEMADILADAVAAEDNAPPKPARKRRKVPVRDAPPVPDPIVSPELAAKVDRYFPRTG